MKKAEEAIAQIARDQSPEHQLTLAQKRIKNLEAEVLEYVRVEAVLVAARKVDSDTITKAHELVRASS